MIRNDIDRVLFQEGVFAEYLASARLGSEIDPSGSIVIEIEFDDENKICTLHHDDGTSTIIADTLFLALHTKK